jgi:ABC-type nitrate/sulfonate/bicarbonate transport system permease component
MSVDKDHGQIFKYAFAALWSVFSMGYITIITMTDIPEKNIRFADTVLGFLLGTIVSTIIGYFFGSSQSSKDKDAAIKASLENHNA